MIHRRAAIFSIALIPTLTIAQVATAAPHFRSESGDTVFPTRAVGCAGDVVSYQTRYQGKTYRGTFRISRPSGLDCEGGRGRWVSGTFEERSQNGTERCKGQLRLYLTLDPRGGSSAQWSNIQTVRGYRCAGVGTTPRLPLFYSEK